MKNLLTPYKMGEFELSHRVVLAPLTRQRSPGGVPQPQHAAVYYSQRATAGGLLISEATLVSDVTAAREYFGDVPGIWAPEHVDAWRPVVDAVHAKGAVFFCQLWHVPCRRRRRDDDDGEKTKLMQVSPQMSFDGRREELSSPRRVAAGDAPRVVDCFRAAARNAVDAGFDGVEILGVNAYFVSDDDEISGGGIESSRSRIRFATEVISAVVLEVGAHRVGIRLDQFSSSTSGDLAAAAAAEEEEDLALEIVKRLNGHGVLYCHMIEPRVDGRRRVSVSRRLAPFREAFGGTFIASGGYGREDGDRAVEEGYADLVAFGRLFLANPDLPRRFELDAPLNGCDKATFYGGGGGDPGVGYTDYPFLAQLTIEQRDEQRTFRGAG